MSSLLEVMCQELDCFECPMNLHKVVEEVRKQPTRKVYGYGLRNA